MTSDAALFLSLLLLHPSYDWLHLCVCNLFNNNHLHVSIPFFQVWENLPIFLYFFNENTGSTFFFSIQWIGLVSLSLDIDYCYGGIWLLLYFPFVLDWIVFSTYVTQDFFFFSLNFNYSPRIYLKLGFTWIFYFYFVTRNTLDLQIYFILYVKKRWFSD